MLWSPSEEHCPPEKHYHRVVHFLVVKYYYVSNLPSSTPSFICIISTKSFLSSNFIMMCTVKYWGHLAPKKSVSGVRPSLRRLCRWFPTPHSYDWVSSSFAHLWIYSCLASWHSCVWMTKSLVTSCGWRTGSRELHVGRGQVVLVTWLVVRSDYMFWCPVPHTSSSGIPSMITVNKLKAYL